MSMWVIRAAACVAICLAAPSPTPNPSNLIAAFPCARLKNKDFEQKYKAFSNRSCARESNPRAAECVKEVEALWDEAVAKCPTEL